MLPGREGDDRTLPGSAVSRRLFTELAEVDFIGEKYLVPSPPEDYLRFKYGPDWATPKQVGYEKDVLDNMPEGTVPGRAGRLQQFLAVHLFPRQAARLLVLDGGGNPVPGAEVIVAGLNRSQTNRRGVAKFYLPGSGQLRAGRYRRWPRGSALRRGAGPWADVRLSTGSRQASRAVLRAHRGVAGARAPHRRGARPPGSGASTAPSWRPPPRSGSARADRRIVAALPVVRLILSRLAGGADDRCPLQLPARGRAADSAATPQCGRPPSVSCCSQSARDLVFRDQGP